MLRCRSMLRSVGAAILSLTLLSLVALPSFAADAPPRIMKQQMKQLMLKDPQLMKEIMADPNHALAMAYRKNLLSFAKALKMAATQGDTVSPQVAQTAVGEMKRSADLLEKQHSAVLSSLPEEKRSRLGDLPKLMDQHLVDVKAGIRNLEKLAKADPVPSKALMDVLQKLSAACEADMHGMRMDGPHGMMPHHDMMGADARDAELLDLVKRMKEASGAEKTDIMADILGRLVHERAEMMPSMHGGYPHGMNMVRPQCAQGCPCPCGAPSMNMDDDDEEDD